MEDDIQVTSAALCLFFFFVALCIVDDSANLISASLVMPAAVHTVKSVHHLLVTPVCSEKSVCGLDREG